MPRDSRMSRVLHVLIHMDRHIERPTSLQISKMLGTNPVVVRRMMSGLRDQGIVVSVKGHGGGWQLTRDLKSVSLYDVYQALGKPALFNIGPQSENPQCYVEQAVDARIEQTLSEAEDLLRLRFTEISIAEIAADFERRMAPQSDTVEPACIT